MDSGRAANSESRTRRRKTNRAASRRDFCLSFDLEVVSERWWILLVTNPLFWIIHTAAKFRLSLQVNPVGRHPRAISLFSARISIIILGVLGPSSMLPEESSTRMQRPAAAFPGWPFSTRTDAVLHGIQCGCWYARRLSSRISGISRLRPDA